MSERFEGERESEEGKVKVIGQMTATLKEERNEGRRKKKGEPFVVISLRFRF